MNYYCIDCGKETKGYSNRCASCAIKGKLNPFYRKHSYPSKKQEQQICNDYFSEERPGVIELAKKYDCGDVTISNIIRRNGYNLRNHKEAAKGKNKKFTKEEELKICHEYFSKKKPSTYILSKKWNCNYVTIRNVILRNGFVLRTHSEVTKGKKNPNYGKHPSGKTKQKIREKTLLQIQNQHGPYTNTIPELKMKEILNELNISFEHQFRIEGINHNFDFHLLNTNILIEVDGDYWHGNPRKFVKLNKRQLGQKQKDIKNGILAKDKDFILIRFWENDVLNNIDKVVEKLKKHIILKEVKKNEICIS